MPLKAVQELGCHFANGKVFLAGVPIDSLDVYMRVFVDGLFDSAVIGMAVPSRASL